MRQRTTNKKKCDGLVTRRKNISDMFVILVIACCNATSGHATILASFVNRINSLLFIFKQNKRNKCLFSACFVIVYFMLHVILRKPISDFAQGCRGCACGANLIENFCFQISIIFTDFGGTVLNNYIIVHQLFAHANKIIL